MPPPKFLLRLVLVFNGQLGFWKSNRTFRRIVVQFKSLTKKRISVCTRSVRGHSEAIATKQQRIAACLKPKGK